MKTLLIMLVCAGALSAQGYNCTRITSDYAGKDISATGVRLIGNAGVTWRGDYDEGHVDDYPIGFTFHYFGQAYTTVDICTNGWIGFNPIQGTLPYMPSSAPGQFPQTSYPNGFVAAGWHDLWGAVLLNYQDGMYCQTTGTAPNREFRVQFRNMVKRNSPGGTMSFLWVFHESTNVIDIHFGNITGGTPFACGLENQSGTDGTASADGWSLTAPATSGYRFEPQPKIEVERAGTQVPNGSSDNAGAMTVAVAGTFTYTVRNNGIAALNIFGLSLAGQANCGAHITASLPAVIQPGGYADFSIEVTPAGPGSLSVIVQVDSDDANDSPYTFTLDASASFMPQPEIELEYAGSSINLNATVDIGSSPAGATMTRVIRVKNTGNVDLTLGGTPAVAIFNMVNCSVALKTATPSTLAPGTHHDCQFEITALAIGPFSAGLSIDNNDGDESPFLLHLAGTAGAAAVESHKGGSSGGCAALTTRGIPMLLPLMLLVALTTRRRRRKAGRV